jgi:hypothetical protein
MKGTLANADLARTISAFPAFLVATIPAEAVPAAVAVRDGLTGLQMAYLQPAAG